MDEDVLRGIVKGEARAKKMTEDLGALGAIIADLLVGPGGTESKEDV